MPFTASVKLIFFFFGLFSKKVENLLIKSCFHGNYLKLDPRIGNEILSVIPVKLNYIFFFPAVCSKISVHRKF
ncbi:hypothetical protein MSSIH_1878 [Methanosarcina siciliae HI350]|uniref:Uncharacterized protein n=1 Tax=Methanosarcina siciliae HI350 TaxID=1434119 RepID=A0A0E3PDI1_9EURY|nr:hypothetical protein MSSIH_1878 [Methanosarcina siciliae HI350]